MAEDTISLIMDIPSHLTRLAQSDLSGAAKSAIEASHNAGKKAKAAFTRRA